MVTATTCVGNSQTTLTYSVQERADITKLFYNLRDGVAWDYNLDAAQRARIANLFSPLYAAFDAD